MPWVVVQSDLHVRKETAMRRSVNASRGHALTMDEHRPWLRVLCLLLLAIAGWDARTLQAQPAAEPIHLADFEILIDGKTKPDDVVARAQLAVNKLFTDIAGQSALEWDPAEFLSSTRLVCDQDPKVALTLGEDAKADFVLAASLTRIRKPSDDPPQPGTKRENEMVLRVSRPGDLMPGIYRGELKLRFTSPELSTPIEGRVGLTVAVRGRRVMGVRFRHEQGESIRYGLPADLEATIDTIDCDLGTGTLQFMYRPALAPEPQNLAPMTVPFPENEFRDPKLVLKANTYPASWNNTAFWTQSAAAERSTGLKTSSCKWIRHTVTLHLGDCDDLGAVKGTLVWPQAEEAPGIQSGLSADCDSTVVEGLWIRPRIAFTQEPIRITLASSTSLGDSVSVILIDENDKPTTVVLKEQVRRESAAPNAPPAPRVANEPYLYQVQVSERRLGTFALRFPEEAVAAHPLLAQLNRGNSQIAVWIKKQEPIKRPLRVFSSFEPFWWDWLQDPYKGNAWRERRSPLWQIEFEQKRLSNVSLSLVPLTERPRFHQGQAEPDREPILEVTGPSGDGIVMPAPVSDPPTESASAAYWSGLASPISLDGEVRFANQDTVRRRPLIGTFDFPVRMSLQAESNGVSVVRIFESTVPVEVTTDMVYYRQIAGYVAAAIVLLLTMFFMYRRFNPPAARSRTRKSAVELVVDSMDDYGQSNRSPPTGTAPPPKENGGGLQGPSQRSDSPSPNPKGKASRKSPPPPPPPPPRGSSRKDDIDNW